MDASDRPVDLQHVMSSCYLSAIAKACLRKTAFALKYIPEEDRNLELCLESVRRNGLILQHVPEKHYTAELILAAVKQNGLAIEDVPSKYLTYALCLEAVRSDPWVIGMIESEFLDEALCTEAVRKDGDVLMDVPYELRTAELCRLAVSQSVAAERFVPAQVRETLSDRIMEDAARRLRSCPTPKEKTEDQRNPDESQQEMPPEARAFQNVPIRLSELNSPAHSSPEALLTYDRHQSAIDDWEAIFKGDNMTTLRPTLFTSVAARPARPHGDDAQAGIPAL